MKKSHRFLNFVLASWLILGGISLFSLLKAPSAPISASAASVSAAEAVIEVCSGRLLFQRNADKKLPMASTTKILTAIIIIEDCDLEKTVKIPKEGTDIEGSSVYLKAGEEYTVKQLLYGLMLRSGNDCAVTLALHHSGSVSAFARVMNERARAWGATHSHFTNPHGLPDDGHYTTARDLAYISRHAMQNPTFREIVSTKYFDQTGWQNKNKLLYQYEGANGVKTGYTVKAGRCLVSGAKQKDMQLVSVVLNSPEMYERSAELLDDCFQRYTMQKLYSAEQEFILPTDVENKTCTVKCDCDFYYPLLANEYTQTKVQLPEKIKLPVQKGENRGKVVIYLENQLIFSQNLCTIKEVKKSYADCLDEVLRNF
ncbi:MAG: D-alanyl-D-alanine carboxypeptidase [Clostridia bacterium]|nr:D-alanyl-D-alanine carboxypeptidase [Clostridia bacterium]